MSQELQLDSSLSKLKGIEQISTARRIDIGVSVHCPGDFQCPLARMIDIRQVETHLGKHADRWLHAQMKACLPEAVDQPLRQIRCREQSYTLQ